MTNILIVRITIYIIASNIHNTEQCQIFHNVSENIPNIKVNQTQKIFFSKIKIYT